MRNFFFIVSILIIISVGIGYFYIYCIDEPDTVQKLTKRKEKIYFIVTTSIINNSTSRREQYAKGINTLKEVLNNEFDYKIIITENNGPRNTYLELFDCEVFYTNNNFISAVNKGYKELKDVLDCINKYNIKDHDFVVKMTGRYFLEKNSEFIRAIKNLNNTKYDCVIRYGSYDNPVDYKTNDCITGLIGMRSRYIKQIEYPTENQAVEWKWANATFLINDKKIFKVKQLGIRMAPGGGDNYNIVV